MLHVHTYKHTHTKPLTEYPGFLLLLFVYAITAIDFNSYSIHYKCLILTVFTINFQALALHIRDCHLRYCNVIDSAVCSLWVLCFFCL